MRISNAKVAPNGIIEEESPIKGAKEHISLYVLLPLLACRRLLEMNKDARYNYFENSKT